jgi:hypothetical protein
MRNKTKATDPSSRLLTDTTGLLAISPSSSVSNKTIESPSLFPDPPLIILFNLAFSASLFPGGVFFPFFTTVFPSVVDRCEPLALVVEVDVAFTFCVVAFGISSSVDCKVRSMTVLAFGIIDAPPPLLCVEADCEFLRSALTLI